MGLPLQKYQVSAPGSLMLFGEHAVLRGKYAVVAAIDKRITIRLTPRADRIIQINSTNFGSCKLHLDNFAINPAFKFVTTAIKSKLSKISSGFTLQIDSDFAANLGLGSSAAVTVATLAVLQQWLANKKYKPLQLCRDARKVIQAVQGRGSGADVAASVFGGVVAYKMQPLQVKKIATSLPLTVVYSGSKLATPVVISKVLARHNKYPQLYKAIFAAMGNCTNAAIQAIKQQERQSIGVLMDIHQELQAALGVNNKLLAELIFTLRALPQISGAKISGSGLGDCVIGLGTVKLNNFPVAAAQKKIGVKQVAVKIQQNGILYGS